jgi:hypothetical protein
VRTAKVRLVGFVSGSGAGGASTTGSSVVTAMPSWVMGGPDFVGLAGGGGSENSVLAESTGVGSAPSPFGWSVWGMSLGFAFEDVVGSDGSSWGCWPGARDESVASGAGVRSFPSTSHNPATSRGSVPNHLA